MFLNENIVSKISREREILYKGEIELFDIALGNFKSIASCRIYEMQYKINRQRGFLGIDIDFINEFEYIYENPSGEAKRGMRKMSCHHEIAISRTEIANTQEELKVVPEITETAYDYNFDKERNVINLSLSADIMFFVTRSFYGNIYECKRNTAGEGGIQTVNWMTVLESIDFNDVLAFLDNFVRLLKIKNIFAGTNISASESETENPDSQPGMNKQLTEAKAELESKLRESKNSLDMLKRELSERDYIIGKLLILLERSEGGSHDPEIPRTTIS